MAGRCRGFLRAVAGTLGLVAPPFVAYQVDPAIMDHIENFIAEKVTKTAKGQLPLFMPEIPFVPTATVKVENMLDTNWAYYLGLLMLLVSFLPTIAQILKLLWKTRCQDDCNDFIILGKTDDVEPLDENAMLPSAFKLAASPTRHRTRTEFGNGALTTWNAPGTINLAAVGGANINLTNLLHLLHGSQAERLVFLVVLQHVFTAILKDLALHHRLFVNACIDLQVSKDAAKHLFLAWIRQSSDRQSIELAMQGQINHLRLAQQQADTKIATLTESEKQLQVDNRANETVIKLLRAQLGERDKNAAPPTTDAGDGKLPTPTTRTPGRFPMAEVMRQRISELEKEVKSLRAQPAASPCSAGNNAGDDQRSTNPAGKEASPATEEASGNNAATGPAPIGTPAAVKDSNSAAPEPSSSVADEQVRFRFLKRSLQPPYHQSYTNRKPLQGAVEAEGSDDGEDEPAGAKPAGSGRKKRRRRNRRRPNGQGAGDGAATGADAPVDA